MRDTRNIRSCRALLASLVGVTGGLLVVVPLEASETAPGDGVINTADMSTGLTAADLVTALLGGSIPAGVTISNEKFNRTASPPYPVPASGGTYTFGGPTEGPDPDGPIGIDSGIILSTGRIFTVEGDAYGVTNTVDTASAPWGMPGDPDLSRLLLTITIDAALLEFDMTVDSAKILRFEYVFSSEEYNEWVFSGFDDGFGIFLVNPPPPPGRPMLQLAWVPRRLPVAIKNVNNGNPLAPGIAAVNPGQYYDNDCNEIKSDPTPAAFPCAPPNHETEMDGLTHILKGGTWLAPGIPYTFKIVIADGGGLVWPPIFGAFFDSNVFLRGYIEDSTFARPGAGGDARDTTASGACCLFDGECEVVTDAECANVGGVFGGDATCSTGACCLDEACVDMTETCCTAEGGTFLGVGNLCGLSGACDLGPVSCVETSSACCVNAAGDYQGNGTTCEAIGACCASDDSCSIARESSCQGPGEQFTRNGSRCIPNICTFERPYSTCPNGTCEPVEDSCICPQDCPGDCSGIPAVSDWGLLVIVLLVLAAGTIAIGRGRAPAALR